MCIPLWPFQAAFMIDCFGVSTSCPAFFSPRLPLCWGQWMWDEPCRVTVSQPSVTPSVQFNSTVLGHSRLLNGPECVRSVMVEWCHRVQTVVSTSSHTLPSCNALLLTGYHLWFTFGLLLCVFCFVFHQAVLNIEKDHACICFYTRTENDTNNVCGYKRKYTQNTSINTQMWATQ